MWLKITLNSSNSVIQYEMAYCSRLYMNANIRMEQGEWINSSGDNCGNVTLKLHTSKAVKCRSLWYIASNNHISQAINHRHYPNYLCAPLLVQSTHCPNPEEDRHKINDVTNNEIFADTALSYDVSIFYLAQQGSTNISGQTSHIYEPKLLEKALNLVGYV